jgi:hypothetical protein
MRFNDWKELEIVVLRHELGILRRQTKRPAMTTVDRLFLAATSQLLPRARWRSFMITPATLLRWHLTVDEEIGRHSGVPVRLVRCHRESYLSMPTRPEHDTSRAQSLRRP